jgi:hypothetical protein
MNAFNQISLRRGRRTKRRAAIMVMNGLFATSACILCGLVVDVGNICVSKAELQRSSDAAALAGTAALLPKTALNGSGWSDPSADANAAWLDAREYVRLNRCRSVTMDLLPEDMALTRYKHDANDPAQSEFINSTSYNSARVTVRRDSVRNGPIPLYFGPIVGIPSVNAMSEAAAFLEKDFEGFGIEPGSGTTCKLLPFSLWEGLWDERAALGSDHYTHNTDNFTVSNGGDGIFEISLFPDRLKDCPGNFGTVDIGNPNNSTSDLSRQILHGPNAYDFSFFPNSQIRISETDPEEPLGRKVLLLNGDTGISAAIKDELYAIRGQPRILPLHWKATGNGNNAQFRIVKFVGVTILDVKLTGALVDKTIVIQPCYTTDGTAIGGGMDGETSEYMFKPPRLRQIKDGK